MFKIKGVASIKLIHPDGREEQFLDNQCNDICWLAFRRFFVYNTTLSIPTRRDATSEVSGSSSRWKLFYGSTPIKQTPLNSWYLAEGSVNVDVNTPSYTQGVLPTDPDIMRLSAVIQAPPSVPRTIQVIGLDIVSNGSFSVPTDLINSHLTILNLTTPCIQAVNVTVVISYDLYFYPTQSTFDQRVNSELYNHMKYLLKQASNAVNSVVMTYGGGVRNISFSSYKLKDLSHCSPMTTYYSSVINEAQFELTSDGLMTLNAAPEVTANVYRTALSFPSAHTNGNGCFIKNQFYIGSGPVNGNNNENKLIYICDTAKIEGDLNPVQNVYAQRNNPPGPSQDLTVNNTGTMTGGLSFNISNWVDPGIQKLVRVYIGSSGDNTAATYKISTMNFIAGFVGNRWQGRTALIPHSFYDNTAFKKPSNPGLYETTVTSAKAGVTYRSPDNSRYVLAATCSRDKSGVNIYDVYTGEKYSMNSANGLSVTAVSDGECTPTHYFVTCANTGLWRISLDRNTVEQIPSPTGVNKAYQICRKNDASNTIWVMFDGGLCKLSNPDDALGSLTWTIHNTSQGTPTFTYNNITNANWANTAAMIIDPDNLSTDRFLFITGTLDGGDSSGANRKGFVWWDTTTGVAANPGTGGTSYSIVGGWTLSAMLAFSDATRCVDGVWFIPRSTASASSLTINRATYGASNLNATYSGFRTSDRVIPATINGVKGIITSQMAISSRTPGIFIKSSNFASLPNTTTIDYTSIYSEFALRNGASSYTAELATTNITAGNLPSSLLYLFNSNFIFSIEQDTEAYGVTPFMLDPSHSKYVSYKGAFWKDYGWDGVSWVLDNTGFKTTHSANEFISLLDNLGISFTNGLTGTSFVASEWFSFVVGDGVFKDNGVVYNTSLGYSLYPTKRIALTGNVPQTPLGVLVDEPVTFVPLQPDKTTSAYGDNGVSTICIQNKGLIVSRPLATGNTSTLISDQLIPASTTFDLRFKWLTLQMVSTATQQYFGLATGAGTYTLGIHFKFNRQTGVLAVYNNTTLLATVTNPDNQGVCSITRDGSNNVVASYNGVQLHAPVVITSQFVVAASALDNSYGQGWYDMKLSYTENRRVYRIGSAVGNTGSYSPKFSSLTYSSLPGDAKVLIGSGSPLQAILDFTSAGVALAGTGRVKVCAGAGWLIFHDSEPANAISGNVTAHFILNHQ